MLKRLFSNRTLTVIIFAAAFVICGIAWMRFFAVAAINPSPTRYVTFVTENGALDPFRQECVGPAFIDGDVVWRYCEYTTHNGIRPVSDSQSVDQWGMVRFDLNAGEALLHWPLPESPDTQILAVAPLPEGDLVVAWGSPDLGAIYRVKRGGGVQPLGVPPDTDAITGLMWVKTEDGAALELLAQPATGSEQDQFVVFAHDLSGESWREDRTITLPPCGSDKILCQFQLARYGERGWEFVIASAPVQITDRAAVQIDFNQLDETMRGLRVGSIDLAELDPSQYTINEAGDLIRLDSLFDQAPANLINWSVDAAPLVFPNDFARRLEAPYPDASFYFSNYEITGDHLHWIPGLRYPIFSWYMDKRITLQAGEDGVVLVHHADSASGKSGEALTKNAALIKQRSQTCVLPASDGGYWILGPDGAYLKADESMSRADSLNVVERVWRSFENFGTLQPVQNESFYREQRALKMAAFPLVLLSLPMGYLLVMFVRQTRPNTRAWIKLLLQVSALYVLLATIFFWWFWKMTGDF
jgi:hypothetical protein